MSKATGLGKGSLYNFFPGGKAEMMEAVLVDIDRWFAAAIFLPLEHVADPTAAITAMIEDVTAYFHAGGRVCLVGCISLNSSGEAFTDRVKGYFARWISALAHCLEAGGVPTSLAVQLAEEGVSGIQGAIVLARALDDKAAFLRIVRRKHLALLDAITRHGDRHTAGSPGSPQPSRDRL